MRDAYAKRLRYMDNAHTKQLVGAENVSHEFLLNVIGAEGDEADEDRA